MSIQHSAIADADLHQCKGAAGAAAGKGVVADGAGAATFQYLNPHGSTVFVDIAAPYTLAYPAAYAKAAPVTTASGLAQEFTEGANARLTYTGTSTITTRLVFNVSLDQAAGANRDIRLAIYKNGVIIPSSVVIGTTQSTFKVLITSIIDTTMATNDYVEAFMQNDGASGDIRIYSFYLSAYGMRG